MVLLFIAHSGIMISFYDELRRKAIHLSALVIPLGVWMTPRHVALVVLGCLAGACLIADVLRMMHPSLRRLYFILFGRIIRDHERKERLTGATYVLGASFLCVWLFEERVAVVALTYMIIGDTTAALVGRRWGRRRIRWDKTVEGALACLGICCLIGVILPLVPWWKALIGAFVATAVELLPSGVDDNLGIPLVSGAIMNALL